MNGRSLRGFAVFALAVVGTVGCSHCCRRPRTYVDPATPSCPSCQRGLPIGGPVIAPPEPRPLPGPVVPPGGGVVAPPQTGLPAAPVPAPPGTSGYEPFPPGPPQNTWRPQADAGVRFAPPEAVSPAPAQTPEPPRAPPAPPAGVSEQTAPTPPLPVGIPQFANARPGVSTGLKPSLDGIEWLRTAGYRAVLHVRLRGEDDTADRRLIEKAGLRYLSLEVSPETLSRPTVERFAEVVTDPANRPLFVYDRTGMLAGGLWYLYFRTVSQDSEEVARLKATRLGLKEDATGEHRDMWLAIQRYLAQQR